MAMYSPSNSTLTCLASAQIQYSGQNAVAQAAALESYYTVMNQTVIGAGASGSAKVQMCCLLVDLVVKGLFYEATPMVASIDYKSC